MPLNDNEFEDVLSDLPKEDQFNTIVEDGILTGTIVEAENISSNDLNHFDLFDGYETHKHAFADYAESVMKIITSDSEFYIVKHRGDDYMSTYKVKE